MKDNHVLVATGELVLEEGDRLIVFAPPEAVLKLEPLFRK